MNFKKPKHQVIDEAMGAASSSMYQTISDIKYNGQSHTLGSNLDRLGAGINVAIASAVRSLVENMYTDQEFEEDLTLRDKNNGT